ncbi:hypothetical protein QJQ45_003448 [Haematococcus lacustris]|nr:hypothetical protein QJQ45_003448 [Haematococcus lacustris]
MSKGQPKHDSRHTKAKRDAARWSAAIQPQLQQLAAATPAGTTLEGLQAHIQALKASWVVEGMKWVYSHHYGQVRELAVFLVAGRFSQGGWRAKGLRKVVEQPSRLPHLPQTRPRPSNLLHLALCHDPSPPMGQVAGPGHQDICLNFKRIEESVQRPLELCSWDDLEALPAIGKENQQGYYLVNDRVPKGRQRLHQAVEYRWGTDGRARNNA